MKPWLLFAVAIVLAAAGLGWVSAELMRLDRRALVSEQSRLALWRMDLALSRLVSIESARAPSDYRVGSIKTPPQDVLVHFDVAPGGRVTTPEENGETALAQLSPLLERAGPPIAMGNAMSDTRNSMEFNRRSNLTMLSMSAIQGAAMAPAWFGDVLVLARRVPLEDGAHLQGAVVDWEALRPRLIREVTDLLPDARLEPVKDKLEGDELQLASLPVRLVPGAPAADPERASVSGVITTAWIAFGLVSLALGLLLFGTLSLDARRAAFVSAVTHELRTPLTTFKLYAEMLEEGMVPEEKRKEYLSTLRTEANRLGYLVENVLAYAQIERGRARKPLEELGSVELLERIVPRLKERAGAKLEVAVTPQCIVKADRISVEQILFNLVDNATRYGGEHIAVRSALAKEMLVISVADAGPGVAPEVERKLFQPLRKSAAEAADGAQGIGLGLALSRRLARAMGGELRYVRGKGATFELTLPLR